MSTLYHTYTNHTGMTTFGISESLFAWDIGRIWFLLWGSFAKETYNLKEPTTQRSIPLSTYFVEIFRCISLSLLTTKYNATDNFSLYFVVVVDCLFVNVSLYFVVSYKLYVYLLASPYLYVYLLASPYLYVYLCLFVNISLYFVASHK